ncbi:hypothetical protein Pyn_16698 [Prunus yedoensis var. nudiflora]|uniref:Uncharacterized protein n=1 Tax=Prunus yedoensis var. nudiflora TaxID=2094558 RepID=A0A314ZEP0_PRUYE|nr:hypothetical protein Pyn_16698 [Prunus yedoensis var. nudiflora]
MSGKMQHLMGIEGVIVDLVQEIKEAVSDMIKPTTTEDGGTKSVGRRREDADAGEIKARVLAEGAFFSFEVDSRVDKALYKFFTIWSSGLIMGLLFNTFVNFWVLGEKTVAKDPSGKEINALEQHIKNLFVDVVLTILGGTLFPMCGLMGIGEPIGRYGDM